MVRLSPTSGPTGTVVVVSGSSFALADTTCLISSSPNGLISSSACTMSTGVVAGSFTVASGAMGGAYMVTVTRKFQADSATTTFTVSPGLLSGAEFWVHWSCCCGLGLWLRWSRYSMRRIIVPERSLLEFDLYDLDWCGVWVFHGGIRGGRFVYS